MHASRSWIDDHIHDGDAVFLARDKKNAFKSANPSKFLVDCAEHMPESARFAEWCYGTPTKLVHHGRVERSYRGQQGCPAMGQCIA